MELDLSCLKECIIFEVYETSNNLVNPRANPPNPLI